MKVRSYIGLLTAGSLGGALIVGIFGWWMLVLIIPIVSLSRKVGIQETLPVSIWMFILSFCNPRMFRGI